MHFRGSELSNGAVRRRTKFRKSRSFNDGYFRKRVSKKTPGTQTLDSAGTTVCSEAVAACSKPLPEEMNSGIICHYF